MSQSSRTAVLEGQGWMLYRVGSPMLFRDFDGVLSISLCKPRQKPKSREKTRSIEHL